MVIYYTSSTLTYTATGIRGAHTCPIHQLVTPQSPVWHRSNGPSRGTNSHPKIPVMSVTFNLVLLTFVAHLDINRITNLENKYVKIVIILSV